MRIHEKPVFVIGLYKGVVLSQGDALRVTDTKQGLGIQRCDAKIALK